MGKAIFLLCSTVAFGQSTAVPTESIVSSLKAGNYEEARQSAIAALKQSPGDARLWTLDGLALNQLGKKSEALEAYNHALQISPAYLPALEGAAEIDYQNGSQRAVPLLEEIVKLQPEGKTAHAMLGGLAFKRSDCKAAVEEFGRSEPLIDSQASALQQYGSCLVKLTGPQEAIPVFERIAELRSTDEKARYNLALVQSLAGRSADVIRTLSPAAVAADPDALDLRAEAYEATSDTPRAVETLRRAIIANPDDVRYYVHFADLCLVHASYKVGVDMLNAGLKRLPRSAALYTARGILLIQLGQYDQGQTDFAKAEQLDPNARSGAAAKSMAALQQNNLAEAEATIRDRLKTRPNDAFLEYLLAETLARRGAAVGTPEFAQAVQAALKAVQLQPGMALARDVLARLYLEAGNVSAAIEQSRLAVRADPTDQTALYHLIRALRKGNQKREIPELMKQLAVLREQARAKEASERKYALVEESATIGPEKR